MRFLSFMMILGWAFALVSPPGSAGAQPHPPLWSPLTSFENHTLERIEAARSGDADTLLALALMASGDMRDQQSYDRVKRRILEFTASIRSDIKRQTSVYARGEKLLHAMHASFFSGGDGGEETELVEGYDSEQSRLSVIFRNGQFNCISSAILYMILARYFDLHVEGVVTAHHAFIQIQDQNGRIIEVETTSKLGYGLIHDADFYKKRFARFSISRNLAVPTYEDYLKRRVLPPYRFIAENMNHQHTGKERMKASHRQRLYEMMGYLDSDTPASQLIRLTALSNACIRLLGKHSAAEAMRMSAVLEPVLQHVKSRGWISRTGEPEISKIWDRISVLHLMQGHLFMKADRYGIAQSQYVRALKWARTKRLQRQARVGHLKSQAYTAFRDQHWNGAVQAYQQLLTLFDPSDHKQTASTRENIAAAYWNWGNSEGDSGDWTEAAERYAAVAHWTLNRDTKAKAKSAQARSKAMLHLQRKEWEQAIGIFKAVLPHQKDGNRKVVRNNIGTAYIQWGNRLFHQQSYDAALDKYEAALGVLEGRDRDLAIRNIAAAYHNMTVPHLKARRVDRAVAILNSGVQRFPDCAPCRDELRKLNRKQAASAHQ